MKKFEICKGPKTKDCTVGSVNITSDSSIALELTVIEDATLDQVRLPLSFSFSLCGKPKKF